MKNVTVVSNRLPVVVSRRIDGGWQLNPGSGGLVKAMSPFLQQSGGSWVGWPGICAEDCDGGLPENLLQEAGAGYRLVPVQLRRDDVDGYYTGFANSVLWPLFHGLADRCHFEPEYWHAYQRVNGLFAQTLEEQVASNSEVMWIHDYHLIPLAENLRRRHNNLRLGFFLHIPFPTLQDYLKLPWRAELLRALLAYDLVGFQTERDCRHFIHCVDRLMPEVRVSSAGRLTSLRAGEHRTWAGVFPIGIDFDAFDRRARSSAVARRLGQLREAVGPRQVLLGVDRLDYTKGLLERLHAYGRLLELHPELHERVQLFQVVVPSRENVPEYRALKQALDRTVGEISGRFATVNWEPIHYMYASVSPEALAALYRLGSVALVTSICDGMNLVSKEYCASRIDCDGALVLSEMAGSATQLADGAQLVNPFDVDGTAEAMLRAINMDVTERRERMQRLRTHVREHDVYQWGESFMDALRWPLSAHPPQSSEYIPTIQMVSG